MDFILRYKWHRIAYLCTFLILVNIPILFFFDMEISRIARWCSTFIFLLFFTYHEGFKDRFIFVILLLFLFRDGLLISYEVPMLKTISFFVTNAAYFLLVALHFKNVKLVTNNPVLMVFAVALLALNAFNLYYLSDVILEGLDNSIQFVLFFTQGVFLITLGLIAFAYNDRYLGHTPLLFLYFSFCLILCDLSGLAAYFFKWEVAFIPERIFYLLSIALLVNYSINTSAIIEESNIFGINKNL